MSPFNPILASGASITAIIRARQTTARAVTLAHLERIERLDGRLGAFTAVTATRALAEADAVDATLARGEDPGPLAGVPYAVKNLFDIAGMVTIAGSKINRDHAPAATDATLVTRLEGLGRRSAWRVEHGRIRL